MNGLPPAGAHGGDGARLARLLGVDVSAVLDLSASLNPVAPPIGPVVGRYLDALDRYPDPVEATEAMAGALGVSPARVLLTNGGAEAIALVAADQGEGWVEDPDFGLYRRHLASVHPGAGRWRSNPHNPSGVLAGPAETAHVWDEAFYPLATGRWTSGAADRGAVVLGSLTKLFACPGLRLGFVLAPPDRGGVELVARLTERQPRWSVNGLALAVVPELLATADLPGWAEAISRLRDGLVEVLRAHHLTPLPAAANYVLVPDCGSLRRRLAAHGVLVRDCTSFGLPDHARIAVPAEAGLVRLTAALEASGPGSFDSGSRGL